MLLQRVITFLISNTIPPTYSNTPTSTRFYSLHIWDFASYFLEPLPVVPLPPPPRKRFHSQGFTRQFPFHYYSTYSHLSWNSNDSQRNHFSGTNRCSWPCSRSRGNSSGFGWVCPGGFVAVAFCRDGLLALLRNGWLLGRERKMRGSRN